MVSVLLYRSHQNGVILYDPYKFLRQVIDITYEIELVIESTLALEECHREVT